MSRELDELIIQANRIQSQIKSIIEETRKCWLPVKRIKIPENYGITCKHLHSYVFSNMISHIVAESMRSEVFKSWNWKIFFPALEHLKPLKKSFI